MYTIEYAEGIANDFKTLRAYERKRILDTIEEQLTYEPMRRTHNKKILAGLAPPWDHIEPAWQLRVDEYRVFYDVDEEASTVLVRAVRHKPPHKTTEEIL